ncbi:MAG: PUA domain-containing protein, partial [Sphingomonas sp.]
SLLAAGATAVSGGFARGDLVEIVGADGRRLARGLAEYDHDDAARLIGHRSDRHAAILGHAPRAALVHRSHMALL